MTRIAAAFAFVALNAFVYSYLGTREVVPPRETFAAFPRDLAAWSCARPLEMEQEVHDVLGVTDYLLCDFAPRDAGDPRDARSVTVYVGYHASQVRRYDESGDKVTSIHPPEHCLPGGGWSIMNRAIVPIRSGGLEGEAKRFVIAKGDARSLVYFWYQSNGRVFARNHEVILYKFWDRATRGRSDGALVRLTAPFREGEAGDEEAAERAILDLARDLTPRFDPYLPR